ncbi:MAG: PepSY domain-containing protein, partial [Beijerinckiaceae bacterium]
DTHDLAKLTSLRQRGGRMIARIHTDRGLIGFVVTKDGLTEPPRNWPRAIHEGNWSPVLAPALNIIVSVVFVGLWITGLLIWARRKLRLRRRKTEITASRMQPAE